MRRCGASLRNRPCRLSMQGVPITPRASDISEGMGGLYAEYQKYLEAEHVEAKAAQGSRTRRRNGRRFVARQRRTRASRYGDFGDAVAKYRAAADHFE